MRERRRRRRRKLSLALRQISLTMLAIGGVMLLNDHGYGKWILSGGGLLFALYLLTKAFEPIHEEPNWELVYPELGLGDYFGRDLEVSNSYKKEEI